MMTAADNQLLKERFKRHASGKFGRIYYSQADSTLLCELLQPYVPIAEFRKLFEKMSKLVPAKKLTKFIFDKRALKSFDQPSMEWYFTTWKEEMYKAGLTMHRKILPPEKWFAQAVIAGRADILKKYPNSVAFKLDIQYCDDLRDAMTKPAAPAHTAEEIASLRVL